MSRFPNARFFYRAYWGERVKWSALSPLRLSAIFFVVKHAFGRNRCVLYVSINAMFLLLKFTLWSSKAYFGYLLHKNPTAFNGSQYLTRGIETEISMVVRILPWFWCCDILGHENNFYHGYKKKNRFDSVMEAAVNWDQTFETEACCKYAKLLLLEKSTMVKNKRTLLAGFVLAKGRTTGLLKFCTVWQNLFVPVQIRSLLSYDYFH